MACFKALGTFPEPRLLLITATIFGLIVSKASL